MERDTANHPRPSAGQVNVTGDDLAAEQLDALTPEQRTRLTSGEPLPVDPRSPLSESTVDADDPAAVAEALDQVEGTGDGDGDGLADQGTGGEDVREDDEAGSSAESDTPLADGLDEPAPWSDR